jgi:hypothetical protein
LTEDSKLFGFAQFDLAGIPGIADGRYVLREDGEETVLVIETLGAPAPPRRRRRRAREVDKQTPPATVPLTRATVIRAFLPFSSEDEAQRWLESVREDESALDPLITESAAALSGALHVHAVVNEDLPPPPISPHLAVAVRVGFGSGEEVADGEWSSAIEVEGQSLSRRLQRTEELRPQARTAAVLGGRERLDACETLLLRARADLDAGRAREAALQLRIGLDALLAELPDALDDPDHREDISALDSRQKEVEQLTRRALGGDLSTDDIVTVGDMLNICERVIRRRRVLRG